MSYTRLDSPRASEDAVVEGSLTGVDLESQIRTPSIRQRLVSALLFLFPVKQTYERLHNGLATGRLQANVPGRFVGQGTDGVFRNLMAKPDTEARVQQEQHPPLYEEAAADATPEYWETTMITPIFEDEVFVQGLPVGNAANFVWNALVTVAFQLVGFVLCYLLHTSHAAKQGTRCGLGVMFVMFGYSAVPANFGHADRTPKKYLLSDFNEIDISKLQSIKTKLLDTFQQNRPKALVESAGAPYLAYGLIAFGLFVSLKSMWDFFHVKRLEKQMLAPQALQTQTVTEFAQRPLAESRRLQRPLEESVRTDDVLDDLEAESRANGV